MTRTRKYFIFFVLFGILRGVSCENYSANPLSFQLNKEAQFESSKFSKENVFENPLQKKINERKRLLFNEDEINPEISSVREGDNNEHFNRRSNFSKSDNEKISDRENVRLRFSFPVNVENSHSFADVSMRQPFVEVKNQNQRFHWENKDNIFDKIQSRLTKEKNFEEFPNQDFGSKHYYNDKIGVKISESEMNRDDERNNYFDRRVSVTKIHDAEVENMKNYDDRVGNVQSGYLSHSNTNYYNRNPYRFWNPHYFNPEKGVVINLKTECSTPREFNNPLVHKFIFAPRSPVCTHSEFSGFQIPESGFISSNKMTPLYY